MEIILDLGNDNVDRLYTLAKSTNDTFYVVKKDLPISPNNSVGESDITENKCNSEDWSITENSKPMLPKFWIIIKIQADHPYQKENVPDSNNTAIRTLLVNVYFHCR